MQCFAGGHLVLTNVNEEDSQLPHPLTLAKLHHTHEVLLEFTIPERRYPQS